MKVDFADIALKENLVSVPEIKLAYKDMKMRYTLMHHFKAPLEGLIGAVEYARFRKTFDRRRERLLTKIDQSESVLFLVSRTWELNRNCILKFEEACKQRWSNKKFYFALVTYNSKNSTYQIDGNTLIVRIARDRNRYDLHEKVFEWSFLDNVTLRCCQ